MAVIERQHALQFLQAEERRTAQAQAAQGAAGGGGGRRCAPPADPEPEAEAGAEEMDQD